MCNKKVLPGNSHSRKQYKKLKNALKNYDWPKFGYEKNNTFNFLSKPAESQKVLCDNLKLVL